MVPSVLREMATSGAGTEGGSWRGRDSRYIIPHSEQQHRTLTGDGDCGGVTAADVHSHTSGCYPTSTGILSSVRGTQWRELQSASGDCAIGCEWSYHNIVSIRCPSIWPSPLNGDVLHPHSLLSLHPTHQSMLLPGSGGAFS